LPYYSKEQTKSGQKQKSTMRTKRKVATARAVPKPKPKLVNNPEKIEASGDNEPCCTLVESFNCGRDVVDLTSIPDTDDDKNGEQKKRKTNEAGINQGK
jgi:hypothetical protein